MESNLDTLRQIPGVGEKMSQALWEIGIRSVRDLKNADPHQLYQKLCDLRGERIDRCVLYVFRCAVYYASNQTHDPKLLKWWNWM